MLVCIYRYAFRHILGFFTILFCTLVRNMFHDKHVLINGMYLPFCFFMSCPELPMGISGVGSLPVWSVFFLFFFSGMYVLHLGVSGCPMHLDTPRCLHMFKHSPVCPQYSPCICQFWGVSACDWGMSGPSCLDTPMCLDTSHVSNTPTHVYAPLHVCMF